MLTSPLRVLFVLDNLKNRSGMVLHVRDLAIELRRRGHLPFVYSSLPGVIADELIRAGVPVLDSLELITIPPDIIHGHNHFDTALALLMFPGVPAVATAHGLSWKNEPPPRLSRILRYIPVSAAVRDLMISEHAIPESRIAVLLNFADLTHFVPRPPLPARPERALMFNGLPLFEHFPAIQEACATAGMTLDVIGGKREQRLAEPWTVLGGYDLVFARGRCAIESMATGAAVIVCGQEGLGPLVTTANYAGLRPQNFGLRLMTKPVTLERVADEIGRYDPEDAAEVSRRLRSEAGLDRAVDDHVALYRTVIQEYRQSADDPRLEARVIGGYLRKLVAHHRDVLARTTHGLQDERNESRKWATKLHRDRTVLTAKVGEMAPELRHLRDEIPRLERERERALARVAAIEQSTLFRWQRRLARLKARFFPA